MHKQNGDGEATGTLGVGIIGASVARGWARESHVVAVRQLSGLTLAAVAGKDQASADAAAKGFKAKAGYGKATDLCQNPDVDIVAVCVKVPDHRELVLGALGAGKHVYCEWPLGRNLRETEELADAARAAGVRTAIGLQTRANPAAQRATERLAAGALGRVLSARVYASTVAFGPKLGEADLYLEKAENGANLVTIQGGHTLDLVVSLLGGLTEMTALGTTQYPVIEVSGKGDEEPERIARSTFDHILLQARLRDQGAVSVEVAGGRPAGTPFRLEVVGETGELVLEGGALRGFQSGRLRLSISGKPEPLEEGETAGLPDPAANVAGMYAALRDDIRAGTAKAPDFQHAVRLARLVDEVLSSARAAKAR